MEVIVNEFPFDMKMAKMSQMEIRKIELVSLFLRRICYQHFALLGTSVFFNVVI
jgi:hypothetical protein